MLAALIDEHIAPVSCNGFHVSYPYESFLIIPAFAIEKRGIAAQNDHMSESLSWVSRGFPEGIRIRLCAWMANAKSPRRLLML
jgi:hypothetical protein